jgi:cytidylate kinase
MKIAICGPAASGKGTIARRLAAELLIGYVDVGLIFRLGAFSVDVKGVKDLVTLLDLVRDGSVAYRWIEGQASIVWQGADITSALCSQRIAHVTSVLAADALQQAELIRVANHILADFRDVVCDGRNAGTSILRGADYMFFVVAQMEERARRRYLDLVRAGDATSYHEVFMCLRERDQRDMNRLCNPFVAPSEAIMLETDTRSIEESVQFIREKIGR